MNIFAEGFEGVVVMPHQVSSYDPMKWREKLTMLRADRRISQVALARSVGLQQSRIGKWELGEGAPSMEQGLRLARALGVSYDYFADDSLDAPPGPELSEDEAFMLRALRGSGIGPDELMKLISNRALLSGPVSASVPATAPQAASPRPDWGARREESQAFTQRIHEDNRPKKVEPKSGKPAEVDAERGKKT